MGYSDNNSIIGNDMIIGHDISISGIIEVEDDIIIEGLATGEIKAEGNVTIGVGGLAKAAISASNIQILGEVNGNISVSGEAIIKESGSVNGSIISSGLTILPGGIFQGRSTIKEDITV